MYSSPKRALTVSYVYSSRLLSTIIYNDSVVCCFGVHQTGTELDNSFIAEPNSQVLYQQR